MKTLLELAALMGVTGAIFAYMRSVPAKVTAWWRARHFITYDMEEHTEPFNWLTFWLNYKNDSLLKGAARLLIIATSARLAKGFGYKCNGDHAFTYKGVRLTLTATIKEVYGSNRIYYHLTVPRAQQEVIEALLSEARDLYEFGDGFRVYTFVQNSWVQARREQFRLIDTLILPKGEAEELLQDAKDFFAGESWYRHRSLPYRRGYLLSGVPGSGKSTICHVLASELQRDIYWVGLNDFGLDAALTNAVSKIPDGSIVAMEDIDTVAPDRDKKTGMSLAGLLNALDSVMGLRGCLTVMTTNHPETLDPALLRPGRVDIKKHFTNADTDQATRLFQRFYGSADKLTGYRSGSMSMAELQEVFLGNRDNPSNALKEIAERGTRTNLRSVEC